MGGCHEKLLEDCLTEKNTQEEKQKSEQAVDVTDDIANLEGIGSQENLEDVVEDDLGSTRDAQGAPIISLGNKILAKALNEGVSDIHVEPQEEFLRIRYRDILPHHNL